MAYTTDKKSTGLELLTDLTITQADLHIIGDVSDSGRAKAITEDNLEDYIANSDNFIDELTNNTNFQTNVNNFVTPGGSPLEIEQDGVSIETSVTKINFTNGPILTNPATGEVDVDFSAILSGGGSGTLIDSDTTQFTVTNGTGVNSLAYTINVPGGTLGTKNAIRVSLLNSSYTAVFGSSLFVSIFYGGQVIGSGSVSVGLSGKMDVSALIVAAGSTNVQKSIAKSISQNTTTGGQITAFTSDYTTTVDSTIDQDITVEISGQFGVTTQQTIEGIVVEKLTKALAGTLENNTQLFLGGGYTDSTQYNNVMTFGDYIISAYRDASNGFVTVTQKKDINGGYNLVSNLAIWSNTGAFSSCVTKSSDGTKLYEMSVGGSNFSPWTFTLKEYDLSGSLVNTSTFVTAAGFMFRTDCIGAVVVGNKVIVSAEFNVSVPASGFWTEFTISGASLTTSTATNLAINTSSTVSYFGGYDGTNIYIALGISGNPLSNGVTEYSYSSPNFTTISTFNQPSVVSTTPSPQEQFFNGFEITGSGTIGIYQNISSFDINSAGNFVNTILKAKYNIFTF